MDCPDNEMEDLDDDVVVGVGGNVFHATFTTFRMFILGSFSVDGFDNSDKNIDEILITIIFVSFVMIVMVIELNTVIAVLGDTFERVQMEAIAGKNKIRAALILEYTDVMSFWAELFKANYGDVDLIIKKIPREASSLRYMAGRVASILAGIFTLPSGIFSCIFMLRISRVAEVEIQSTWTHVLRPEGARRDAWAGRVSAIRTKISDDLKIKLDQVGAFSIVDLLNEVMGKMTKDTEVLKKEILNTQSSLEEFKSSQDSNTESLERRILGISSVRGSS